MAVPLLGQPGAESSGLVRPCSRLTHFVPGGGVGAEARVTQRVGTELKASRRAARSRRPVEGAQDAAFWPSGSRDSWREAVRGRAFLVAS